MIVAATSGAQMVAGARGQQGVPGIGVPAGGTTGQVLAKASATDHDAEWIDPPEGGGGGLTESDLLAWLAPLTAEMSLVKTGLGSGWLDSLTDQSGIDAPSSAGVWSVGQFGASAGANLIPAMTSDSAPSGACSASSTYNSNYLAWKAFNHTLVDIYDAWLSSGTGTQWVRYALPSPGTVTGFAIQNRQSGEIASPNTFKLQSSTDDSTWTDRHSVTGSGDNTASAVRTYTLAASATARYWRLVITSGNGGSTYYAVGELFLYGATAVTLVSSTTTLAVATTSVAIVAVVAGIASGKADSGDLHMYVSTDGGSNWTDATLTEDVIATTTSRFTATVTVPSGTALRVKVTMTEAIAGASVHAWGAAW